MNNLSLDAQELEKIREALGSNSQVAYAPPNIYPMSAPSFQTSPSASREEPATDQLGIYIHIPFCNYTCSFCFYAKELPKSQDELKDYVKLVKKELSWLKPGFRLTQLYMGGGTPTVLPPALLDEILTAVFERMQPNTQQVHTVECSPESITPGHVEVLKRQGIERVSMGVQSLENRVLDTVNRGHFAQQVITACDLLVSNGLMLNVDLIYGLPGQSEESFIKDFKTLVGRGVHSITAYNLRVNESTPIGRAINEQERLDLMHLMRWRDAINNLAESEGFEQTRWHTFKRVNPTTAANIVSRFEDLTGQGNQLGLGVSARSRINNTVYRNYSKYHPYQERIESGQSPVEQTLLLSEEERKIRFVALSLGDGKPLSHQAYFEEFNCSLSQDFAEPLQRLQSVHLITDDTQQVTLTASGRLLYDLVMKAFYPRHLQDLLKERQEKALTSLNLRSKT